MAFYETCVNVSSMRKKSPKRLYPSIKRDGVSPGDFLKYRLPWACEDCVHFDPGPESCTLGYNTIPHLRRHQQKSYELSGRMALCRFQELD